MAVKKKESVPEEQVGVAEDVEKKPTVKRSVAKKTAEAVAEGDESGKKPKRSSAKTAAEKAEVADEVAEPAPVKRVRVKAEPVADPEEKKVRTSRAVKKSVAEEETTEAAAPKKATRTRIAAKAVETEAKPEEAPKKKSVATELTEEVAVEEEVAVDEDSSEENTEHHDAPEEHSGEEKTAAVKMFADLAEKTKEQLVDTFAEALASRPVQSLRNEAEAIKVAFYKLHRAEVDALRNTFMDAGGNEEEFAPPVDMVELRFKELFQEYRHKRDAFTANIERNKEENLRIKQQLIDELKELVNSTETLNATFNAFRAIQQRWRETGLVPQANMKDLWETYNLHVENFYNYIKINKELRDLDLKRNYEAKLRLCEESEALILEPSVVNAFHKLQKLHEQWRETGPVSNEYKETLWERFKEASARINKQHQGHFEQQKEEQKQNLNLKAELCIKIEELAGADFMSRKEWEKASEQLVEIQKVWRTIGYAPKRDNTRIYERFRAACDNFFMQKRNFYQQSKGEMDLNLQQKVQICEMAEALRESTDWKKATDELIELQKQWKAIGPVTRRHSDAVWKRFRAACDNFFTRKQGHFSTIDNEYDENLQRKETLLNEIEAHGVGEGGFEAVKDFQRRWGEIGFVPIKQKEAIQKRYKEAMDKLFDALRGSERDRQMDRFKGRVSGMKTTGDKRLRFERERLYNKVKQLESDIATLENNIGFFARSKSADTMIAEVNRKIEEAKAEMAAAIEKINVIDRQE